MRERLREGKTHFRFTGDYGSAVRCCLWSARSCLNEGDVFREFSALRMAIVYMSLIEGFDGAVKSHVLKRMEKLQTSVFSIVNAKDANKDDAAAWRVPLLCDFALCYMLTRERETAFDYLCQASYLEAKVWVHPRVQDYVAVLIRTLEGDIDYVKEHIRSSPYLSQDSPLARTL